MADDLAERPEVIFRAKPSLRRAYLFSLLYAGGVLYGRIVTELDPTFNRLWWILFFLLMFLLVWVHLARWCTDYLITSDEVIAQSGILGRTIVAVPHNRITTANVKQSFFERLLGIASLCVDSAGGGPSDLTFRRITTAETEQAAGFIRSLKKKADT